MKLLICTQAIDPQDPELGFFPAWVEGLAHHAEQVTVFCLRANNYHFPPHVQVVVLGGNRISKAIALVRHSIRLRSEYDTVLVHMNQEYILVAGSLWKRMGKRVYLWRNHYAGTTATDIAARRSNKVFYTSKHSYTAKYPNAVKMPVGVDLELFTRLPEVPRDPRGILFLGRLAPSKRPHLLLQALELLMRKGVTFSASFYGPSGSDLSYVEKLKDLVHELKLSESVQFMPPVAHAETPQIFNRFGIFVNCSPSGMYDKTLFEAASSECMVVAASKDFAELVPPRFVFEDNNPEDLARKLESLLSLSVLEVQGAGAQMHNIAKTMSLPNLMEALVREMRV